ncbi:hypothetical protein EVAR_99235_1 [Eumeta japonica]|uniref:Uncharacterized protein n=1 Tax=Eumeta variegata TaxID=151549 RepID=A0A4C2AB55_EUMVA|nr:hypothetical protein EVAR_99235_1 [Eumeta japonica]
MPFCTALAAVVRSKEERLALKLVVLVVSTVATRMLCSDESPQQDTKMLHNDHFNYFPLEKQVERQLINEPLASLTSYEFKFHTYQRSAHCHATLMECELQMDVAVLPRAHMCINR